MFRRKRIDTDIERRILTGLIVSKKFLNQVVDVIDYDYFENRWVKLVAQWCINYFKHEGTAPGNHVNDILITKKKRLKDDEIDLIETLLQDAATDYRNREKFNVEYMVEQALGYFKKRHLAIISANINTYLSEGEVQKAETEVLGYKKIAKKLHDWVNPFDRSSLVDILYEEDSEFFTMPYHLGDFLGSFDRSWLVGISAPFKRGKTWFAQEFALQGLQLGLKVAFFSLEMTKKDMVKRIVKRLIPGFEKSHYLYPIFDCKYNLTGECEAKRRENTVTIVNEESEMMSYSEAKDMGYKPCTFCRGKKNLNRNFEPAQYYAEINFPKEQNVFKEIASFNRIYGKKFKLKIYPKFSANVADIKHELDNFEASDGFIPDMIIIDHADCLKPEDDRKQGIEKEDETWMTLAQLAGERRVLTIVPTQVTKEALNAAMTEQKHTARWVGKLGHVDVMLAMSQNEFEKKRGVMRISKMMHRHHEYNQKDSVAILQNLDAGQFHLDSEFYNSEIGIQLFKKQH